MYTHASGRIRVALPEYTGPRPLLPREWLRGGRLDDGEFDAAAKRVDAFGTDANAVAQAEDAAGVAARRAIRLSDDGMIAFAIGTAHAGGFLETIDRHQAFHEHLREFNEEAEF